LEALGITDVGVSSVTYTEGGGVDTMVIGGKAVTGTELRKLFGLKSTQFTMEITQDTVEFLVQGNGHRVGMSQYGAETMAQAGKTYVEILKWYYTGVEITEYR
jgi:stage II sporulation protein D